MRPINKGGWPVRGGGRKYVFNDWKKAKRHLIDRTGLYCHLCEMRVNNSLAVEHIKARVDFPKLASSWTNFLLVCTSCNSRKLASRLAAPYRQHYYWPHLNNPLLAFDCPLAGPNAQLEVPRAGLSPGQQARAAATIALYQLDQRSTATGDSDNRYVERQKATKMAIDRRLEYVDGKATIAAIVDMAQTSGFFSVWLAVFADLAPVRLALLHAPDYKIDVGAWFDAQLNPVPRNPGNADPI